MARSGLTIVRKQERPCVVGRLDKIELMKKRGVIRVPAVHSSVVDTALENFSLGLSQTLRFILGHPTNRGRPISAMARFASGRFRAGCRTRSSSTGSMAPGLTPAAA